MITITRKIQINIVNADKKAAWAKLYEYQKIVHQAANLISTHQFCMDNIKQFVYLTEGTKCKLANKTKDDEGILTTSRMNTTYQLCSSIYKSQIPMSIITALNSNVVKSFNKESKDYYIGKRSLRSYRNTIPIPINSRDIKLFEYNPEKKNYKFNIYDFEFMTYLGMDKSGNKAIIDRCLNKEYKLCGGSIKLESKFEKEEQLDGTVKKIKRIRVYLLLTCQFNAKEMNLDENKVCKAELSFNEPVLLKFNKLQYSIGSKEDYLYKRLQIQSKLWRLQKAIKHNTGGHGRKIKLQALDKFKVKETNYINNKLHNYSREIINYCVKNNCGTLRLMDINDISKDLQEEENKFILRNWTYFGFLEKIKYKANMVGIKIQVA